MKKLSDCIKLITGYKKQKKGLITHIVVGTVLDVMFFCLIPAIIWLTINASPIFAMTNMSILLSNIILTRGIIDSRTELNELKENYKVSLNVVEAFSKKLKAKGINLSKDSLVKSNVHTNKKVNDMKTITAVLDDSKKEIRIIEEPKESSIMTATNGLSVIPSPKEIEDSVYYVDENLVIDEPEEKQEFNGNARTKRRRF